MDELYQGPNTLDPQAMNSIRIMTFNLRGSGYPQDAPNIWENRAALNLKTIRRWAPDLIGFQELQTGNRETYDNELIEYDSILGTPSNEPDFYNYNSIYWNPLRLKLVETGGMFLSENPSVWSKSWDSVFVRSLNWAYFVELESGNGFLHFNTHLDHVGVQARVAAVRLIIEKAETLSKSEGSNHTPVIVTGDFNCIPWLPGNPGSDGVDFRDRGYSIFRQYGFRDTYLESGHSDHEASHTYHGYEGTAFRGFKDGVAQRIDWILIKDGNLKWITKDCTIIQDGEPPIYPSDHYPVISEVAFETN